METAKRILVKGGAIVIDHLQGKETGTILGWINIPTYGIRVDVQFGDGTISTWPWNQVDTLATVILLNTTN